MREDIDGVTCEYAMKMYNFFKAQFLLMHNPWYAVRACAYARYINLTPHPMLAVVAELEGHRDLR